MQPTIIGARAIGGTIGAHLIRDPADVPAERARISSSEDQVDGALVDADPAAAQDRATR